MGSFRTGFDASTRISATGLKPRIGSIREDKIVGFTKYSGNRQKPLPGAAFKLINAMVNRTVGTTSRGVPILRRVEIPGRIVRKDGALCFVADSAKPIARK